MLARSIDGSRPRPPAKMRRRSSLAQLNSSNTSLVAEGSMEAISSSPPPAYASTPGTGNMNMGHAFPDTLLGSPVPASFRFKPLLEEAPAPTTNEWPIDEKSKEELEEILHKAEDIIKERGNELGITASVVKSLYENSIALKTKHEAFVARLPTQTQHAPESPISPSSEDHCHIVTRSVSNSSFSSVEDSAFISPPAPPFYRRHARRVSMSTTEISMLADQNAEVMHKLEQLESESSIADQAGRRSLKRLEKEIAYLREALEKTQAKSDELEEKTKGLDKGIDRVVEDAWKRKRDRELRLQALKAGRDAAPVRDFAPKGGFLGHPALTRAGSGNSTLSQSFLDEEDIEEDEFGEDEDQTLVHGQPIAEAAAISQPQHDIIKQLLQKVQELEDTNTRILQQQQETVDQLQTVQRETEQMSKVYDYLGDPQEVDIELEDEAQMNSAFQTPAKGDGFLNRSLSDPRQGAERDFFPNSSVSRRGGRSRTIASLRGLYDRTEGSRTPGQAQPSRFSTPPPQTWDDNRHRSSYSMDAGYVSPALSSLSFLNSPQHFGLDEIVPLGDQKTLDAELGQHCDGDQWGSQRGSFHLRTQSLAGFSQWSTPPSPSPAPSGACLPSLSNLNTPATNNALNLTSIPALCEPAKSTPTSRSGGGGDLTLSVDPPTPEKQQRLRPSGSRASLLSQDHLTPGGRSPRQQFISQRIKDRRSRWEDERFGSLSSISSATWGNDTHGTPSAGGTTPTGILADGVKRDVVGSVFIAPASASSNATLRPRGHTPMRRRAPRRIGAIVDGLVDQFDGANGGKAAPAEFAREATPDTESGYEESDEGDSEYDYVSEEFDDSSFETNGYDEDDEETEAETPHRTPQLALDNALQLRQSTSSMPRTPNKTQFAYGDSPRARFQRPAAGFGPGGAVAAGKPMAKKGWGNVLLELWLWLQFAVIMLVFLCAMAKRGPKAVLADAETRVGTGPRTRKTSLLKRY